MKKIYRNFTVLLILLASACNLDGDLQNPNEITVAGADVNLLMNAVQLDFADFYGNAAYTVDPLMRMQSMTGGFRYQTAYQPQNVDGIWSQAYRNVLTNAETLIPLATSKNLTTHVAVAKLLEAYTYITLVDVFGDVPQSEALKAATGNFNPKADGGEAVYDNAISLITEARTQLALTGAAAGAVLSRDIYYAGSRTKWTALANSLELKAQLNLSTFPARAAGANARITALLASNLIDATDGSEDFTYKYGTATVPSGSRHPLYDQYYGASPGSAGGYINTQFMYELYKGKPDPAADADPAKWTNDPRWRYYFYRQVGSRVKMDGTDPKALGCTPAAPPVHYAGYPFCFFDPGFYGRDHGDASGTPPDSPFVTAWGVYPAGGKSDDNSASNSTTPSSSGYLGSTVRGDGANGAGILPIYMGFYTDFVKAEIQERATPGSGQPLLITAITNNINAVKAFALAKKQNLVSQAATSTPTYLSAINAQWNSPTARGFSTRKMDIIGKEFYIACWGNGVEAYNLYRRTSAPKNLQPTFQTGPGPWLRSMTYPAVYVNLNSNAKQKDYSVTNKVFWDGNSDQLN